MASDLLAKGRTKVKRLVFREKDKTYDADVVLSTATISMYISGWT